MANDNYKEYKRAFFRHRKEHPRKRETRDSLDQTFCPNDTFFLENESGEDLSLAKLGTLYLGTEAYMLAQRTDLGDGKNETICFRLENEITEEPVFEDLDEEIVVQVKQMMKERFIQDFHYLV